MGTNLLTNFPCHLAADCDGLFVVPHLANNLYWSAWTFFLTFLRQVTVAGRLPHSNSRRHLLTTSNDTADSPNASIKFNRKHLITARPLWHWYDLPEQVQTCNLIALVSASNITGKLTTFITWKRASSEAGGSPSKYPDSTILFVKRAREERARERKKRQHADISTCKFAAYHPAGHVTSFSLKANNIRFGIYPRHVRSDRRRQSIRSGRKCRWKWKEKAAT